jgi:hypothetical protein
MPDNQQNLYRDMEVVYKPAVQRLRDDMKRIRDLAQEIALLAASHDYPEIKTEVTKGTAKSPCTTRPSHHPYACFCALCQLSDRNRNVYEQVDLDHERRGD